MSGKKSTRRCVERSIWEESFFKQCVSFLGRRRTARHLKALYVLLPSVEGVFVATETRLLREELTNNPSIALALASIRFSLIFDTFNYTL